MQESAIKESEQNGDWDLEIKPHKKLFDLHLAETWRYRDLVALMVRRDFVAQYTQTVLGPVWHIVQPALTTIIFLLVFGRIARIPTDGIEPTLFYMSGITLWNYFSGCLLSSSTTFTTNSNIFGKVYFPRIVMPVSSVISNIYRFGIQFGLLFVMMIWYHFNGSPIVFSVYWLFLPLLILIMAIIGLGAGIVISSMTTRYRDFTILMTFVVQLLMYATPVVYPMSFLKTKSVAWIIQLNPLSGVFEAFRFCIFGAGTFDATDIIYSVGFAVVVLFVGLILFSRVEKSFMDTV